MKNLFKISAMALAVVMAFVLVLTTKAADDSLVTVTLSEGTSTCTLNAFDMSTWVSVNQQTVTDTENLSCDFIATASQTLTMVSDPLVNGSVYTITGADVNGEGTNLTQNGTLAASGTSLLASSALDVAQTVYVKNINEMGTMTQDIEITVTIDGGTPAGVYTGYLDLIIT